MIYRQLKFEVVYKIAEEWRREAVLELLCDAQMGVNAVKTASGAELPYDPIQLAVLQFTGQFDKDGREIYHGHLLADHDSGDIFEVVAYHGGFHLQCGEKTFELSDEMCMKLKIAGDALTNANLLLPPDAEQVLEDAVKRSTKQ